MRKIKKTCFLCDGVTCDGVTSIPIFNFHKKHFSSFQIQFFVKWLEEDLQKPSLNLNLSWFYPSKESMVLMNQIAKMNADVSFW